MLQQAESTAMKEVHESSTSLPESATKRKTGPRGCYSQAQVMEATLESFEGDELAAHTWVTKYALRDGDGVFVEKTPADMHRRLAREFARIESGYENSMSEEEIYGLLSDWTVVAQGSPMSGVGNSFQLQSVSNCFGISAPFDSYGGILLTDQQQAQIMKRRGGVGFDISTLRPKGVPTANAAHTTDGLGIFMERFSHTCGEVGQGGRRGALMLTCDVHHPEVRRFINIKDDKTTCKACGHEERAKVTKANVSVRLSDEFLEAVERGEKYQMRWPCDEREKPAIEEWVDAREIWDEINQHARDSAEPGLLFWDHVLRQSPADCYADAGFRTITTNPCMTGDTLVAVADGRGFVKFEDLAREGRDVPVYACGDGGRVVVKTMRNPGVTGHKRVLKVTLDDGTTLRCTANHKFLLREGVYAAADELKPGDSLHVGYRYEASIKDRWPKLSQRGQDYLWLRNCNSRYSKAEHRLIWEFHNGAIPRDHVVHHADLDAQNNVIENLECMSKKAPDSLHAGEKRGAKNPIHAVFGDPVRGPQLRAKIFEAVSGTGNPRWCGLTNEELLQEVSRWVREEGAIPTKAQYMEEAARRGWPRAWANVSYRATAFSSVNGLIRHAAEEAGVQGRVVPSTSQDTTLRLGYARSLTDLPLVVQDGEVLVVRTCGHCGREFRVEMSRRGQKCCSPACSSRKQAREEGFRRKHLAGIRGVAARRMRHVRDDQLRVFTALRFEGGRDPLRREWESRCKIEEVPFGIRKTLKNGFKSYAELREAARDYNHRVVSIEEDGIEDVYNGSVDDVHNYYVAGAVSTSRHGKAQRVLLNSRNCSEIPLSGSDACRLLLVNLSKFVRDPFTADATFEWEHLHEVTKKAQRLMDDLVDIELEQVDKILAKIEADPEPEHVKAVELEMWQQIRKSGENGRRTGLGVTAVGDAIAMLGHKYGSDESIELVERLYRALAVASYESSIEMAAERGCFPVYDYRKETGHPFIERVLEAGGAELRTKYERSGRRNIANLTTAPTGSVSLLTQTSSGIEPVFRALHTRRKRINSGDEDARVDHVDEAGDPWTEYTVRHHGFIKWQQVTGKSDEDFADSPYYGAEAHDLDWNQRVKFQAAATRWLDHAVSSTINLPEDVPVETVEKIHRTAWKAGCKGITTYRENARDGVLVEKREFIQHNAPKRPERLPCDVHRSRVKRDDGEYEDWTIFVGLFEGKPYEVFGGTTDNIELPRKVTEGHIVKRSLRTAGKYDFYYGDSEDPFKIKDIVRQFDNADRGWATRMISLALRHGSPPQYMVEQLQHDKDSDLYDFAKAVARVLKKYIQDGTKSGKRVCPKCEAEDSLRYQEGCLLCISCSYSKCM